MEIKISERQKGQRGAIALDRGGGCVTQPHLPTCRTAGGLCAAFLLEDVKKLED